MIRCPCCTANLLLAQGRRCGQCGAILELQQTAKPLSLRAGVLLMQLNAMLILYCVAFHIDVANFASIYAVDANATKVILVSIAILKLVLAQLMSNGVNWARISCWVFVFWPHGSGSIHEMNLFIMNHLSLILLFLSPSNTWFREVRAFQRSF